MNEAIEFLMKNPTGYLATVSIDGKPKLRPFTFFFEKEGKLWFETSNDKNVHREILNNPNVEFSVLGAKMSWVRLSGIARLVNRMDIKKYMFDKTKNLVFLYGSPDNPVFEVFYLENAKAILYSFDGHPKEYIFN